MGSAYAAPTEPSPEPPAAGFQLSMVKINPSRRPPMTTNPTSMSALDMDAPRVLISSWGHSSERATTSGNRRRGCHSTGVAGMSVSSAEGHLSGHFPRGFPPRAVATRTPTGSCADTSRAASICRTIAKPNSAPSLASSTSDLERPCITKRQRRNFKLVLQRSVETTSRIGRLSKSLL